MFASKVTTSKINEIKIYILSNIKAFWTSIIKKKKKTQSFQRDEYNRIMTIRIEDKTVLHY